MAASNIVIHWFRQDLRLTDNPALFEASQKGKVLTSLYFRRYSCW